MDIYDISAAIAAYSWKIKLQRYYLIHSFSNIRLKNSKSDIVYVWPPYGSSDDIDLCRLLQNIKHYIANLGINVVYYVGTNNLVKYEYSVVCNKVISRETVDNATAKNNLKNARYCLLWRVAGRPKAISLQPNKYIIDENLELPSATEWLRLTYDLYVARYELPIRAINFPIYPVNTCAVLGGGPSIKHFYDEQSEWDAWIGCNFLACDPKLRNAGPPFALCLLDPNIFSPMESMRPLWKCAFEILRESPAILITAYKCAPFIEMNLPDDIKAKCHYVKTVGNESFGITTNYNLKNLKVTPYGNVFTDLMLPVAAAMSKKIILYGCDGSPPEAKGNFPKSEHYKAYEERLKKELNGKYSDEFYTNSIRKHSLYSRYVVNECLRQGVKISIRCPSWNRGLQCLPVEINNIERDIC